MFDIHFVICKIELSADKMMDLFSDFSILNVCSFKCVCVLGKFTVGGHNNVTQNNKNKGLEKI